MNLPYLLPRLARHFLPERLVRFLLLRGWVIRPGLETRQPHAAIQNYLDALEGCGFSLNGKRVMVFGYGGRFDLGLGLLEAGAEGVVLCEKDAPPDDAHNRALLPRYGAHLVLDGKRVRPRSARLTLLQGDVRCLSPAEFAPLDLVVSRSVYEHLDDVEGVTRALAALTSPHGLQVHFVDLRDHFFRYPFEMLCYSERVWRGWLDPSTHHNRYRLWDYRRAFEQCFEHVEVRVLARDEPAFQKARPRIRPEFISGNVEEDSATLIRVLASRPRRSLLR